MLGAFVFVVLQPETSVAASDRVLFWGDRYAAVHGVNRYGAANSRARVVSSVCSVCWTLPVAEFGTRNICQVANVKTDGILRLDRASVLSILVGD